MIGGHGDAAPDIIKGILDIPTGAYLFHFIHRHAGSPHIHDNGRDIGKMQNRKNYNQRDCAGCKVQLAHGAVQLLHAMMQFNLEYWALDDAIRQVITMRDRQCVQVISTLGKR